MKEQLKQFLINQRDRFFYGSLLMALTVVGIPFIPFVPIAMALGCWDLYGETAPGNGLGEMLGSIVITFLIGIICYAFAIVLLIVKFH